MRTFIYLLSLLNKNNKIVATTSDIRKGMCLEFNGQTYIIVEFLHVKPGKGNAFVRTKLKNLSNGKVVDQTFSAGHKIDDVRVERRKYQYLYDDDERFYFMNNETYGKIDLIKEMVDNNQFLKKVKMWKRYSMLKKKWY